jgi:hypothetical protein
MNMKYSIEVDESSANDFVFGRDLVAGVYLVDRFREDGPSDKVLLIVGWDGSRVGLGLDGRDNQPRDFLDYRDRKFYGVRKVYELSIKVK